ncbi:hypothetical protein GCM10020295_01690 [Streptomyces cinereospinus]
MLGLELLVVVAHAAAGYAVGLTLPRLLAVPVALVGSFVWMAYPASMNVFWVRQLNGTNLAECCSLDQVTAPRSILAPALVAIGMIVAARLTAPRRWLRRVMAPAVLAIAVALAAWIVRPLGYSAVEPRPTELRTCTDTRPRVCLWPEQQHAAADVTAWATDAHARLAAAGVTTRSELSLRSLSPNRDEVRSLIALSAIPQSVPACAQHGQWPGNLAFGPLSAWLTLTAGTDPGEVAARYVPEEAATATKVLERPRQAQLAWFRYNERTLTRCDRQPILDPARF